MALGAALSFGGLGVVEHSPAHASSARDPILDLPSPPCVKKRGRKDDCSAKFAWADFRPYALLGDPAEVENAAVAMIGLADRNSAGHLVTHANSNRYCLAFAVNTYLTQVSNNSKVISDMRLVLAFALDLPELPKLSKVKGAQLAVDQYKAVFPIIWREIERQKLRAAAQFAVSRTFELNQRSGC